MAGGYEHKPDGTEGVGGLLKQLQTQVNALRGGAGIRSAILRGVQLLFQDENGSRVGSFGTMPVTLFSGGERTGTDVFRGVAFFDPDADQGPDNAAYIMLAGSYEGEDLTTFQVGDASDIATLDLFRVMAADVTINGNDIDITSSGTLGLNSPIWDVRTSYLNTASAANCHLGTDGRIHRSTSARKYKTDIADADVDPAEVLALVGRTFIDREKLQHWPEGDLRRDIGFVAEELDDYPSLRQFVVYDKNGDPDSIEYDRLTVALLAVLKDQQERIDDHEKRLTALEKNRKKP